MQFQIYTMYSFRCGWAIRNHAHQPSETVHDTKLDQLGMCKVTTLVVGHAWPHTANIVAELLIGRPLDRIKRD